MVYTLSQYATVEKEPLAKGMMLGIAQEGVVADLLKWRSISALSETGVRFDELPDVAFVALNGTISETTIDGKQITHTVYQILHHIEIPAPLEEFSGPVLQRASVTQMNLAKKGAAFKVNDTFINGDVGSDPNSFNGLNKIVGGLSSNQTVGASQLDISSTSNGIAAIDRLEVAMHRTDGHKPTAGFGNEQFLLRFESHLRQQGLLGNDYNWKQARLDVNNPRELGSRAADLPAFMWRDVPFFDLGLKTDQATQIILNTYTDGGLGSSDNTRVFFIKENSDNLEAIQAEPLSMKPVGGGGTLEDKDNYRWRLKWIVGLAPWGPRCVSKAIGLKVT